MDCYESWLRTWFRDIWGHEYLVSNWFSGLTSLASTQPVPIKHFPLCIRFYRRTYRKRHDSQDIKTHPVRQQLRRTPVLFHCFTLPSKHQWGLPEQRQRGLRASHPLLCEGLLNGLIVGAVCVWMPKASAAAQPCSRTNSLSLYPHSSWDTEKQAVCVYEWLCVCVWIPRSHGHECGSETAIWSTVRSVSQEV